MQTQPSVTVNWSRRKLWAAKLLLVLGGALTGLLLTETALRPGRQRNLEAAAKSDMNVLGISAYYHDSAACLVRDGEFVAAAQEERFTRKKHDHRFPAAAVEFCLRHARITPAKLAFVAFYDKPPLKFERLIKPILITPRAVCALS